MEELPQRLGDLEDLEELHLTLSAYRFELLITLRSSNKLKLLPESLGMLSKLRDLRVDANLLRCLPDSIGQNLQLRELHLSSNELIELPETIGQLKQLETCLGSS